MKWRWLLVDPPCRTMADLDMYIWEIQPWRRQVKAKLMRFLAWAGWIVAAIQGVLSNLPPR